MRSVLLTFKPHAPFSVSCHRERHVSSTLDYLPGSTVRGAFATDWIRRHGKDERFAAVFLSGDVRFPFLHPGGEGSRPAPLTARSCKASPAPLGHPLRDAALAMASSSPDMVASCSEIGCGSRMVRWRGLLDRDGRPQDLKVVREVRMHVAIREDTGTASEGQLFGVEVVMPQARSFLGGAADKELVLSGWLRGSDSVIAALVEEYDGGTVWVGRSRGNGLGECEVSFREAGEGDSTARLQAWLEKDVPLAGDGIPIAVTLTSPAILIDGWLRYHFDLVAALREELGLSEAICLVETERVFGWNAPGRLPKAVEEAVSAGSVLLGRSNLSAGELAESVRRLELSGIGSRRQEGFGAIIAWDPFLLEG